MEPTLAASESEHARASAPWDADDPSGFIGVRIEKGSVPRLGLVFCRDDREVGVWQMCEQSRDLDRSWIAKRGVCVGDREQLHVQRSSQ
jgi:hypothetical protein